MAHFANFPVPPNPPGPGPAGPLPSATRFMLLEPKGTIEWTIGLFIWDGIGGVVRYLTAATPPAWYSYAIKFRTSLPNYYYFDEVQGKNTWVIQYASLNASAIPLQVTRGNYPALVVPMGFFSAGAFYGWLDAESV